MTLIGAKCHRKNKHINLMQSTTSHIEPATRGFVSQFPRNLAANIAYFRVNVAIRALLLLHLSGYYLTRSGQSYSPTFFLPSDRMMIAPPQNIACSFSPSPNPCIVLGGEAF